MVLIILRRGMRDLLQSALLLLMIVAGSLSGNGHRRRVCGTLVFVHRGPWFFLPAETSTRAVYTIAFTTTFQKRLCFSIAYVHATAKSTEPATTTAFEIYVYHPAETPYWLPC